MGKKELVALLSLSWRLVIVVWRYRDAKGLSAVCDCGISCSYSLAIFLHSLGFRQYVLIRGESFPLRPDDTSSRSLAFRPLHHG